MRRELTVHPDAIPPRDQLSTSQQSGEHCVWCGGWVMTDSATLGRVELGGGLAGCYGCTRAHAEPAA